MTGAEDLRVNASGARRTPLRALLLVFICASAVVVARSIVFMAYEGLHFDADQAVFGLMAKHLVEGRAFPLYMYGQHYMLAVSVWLAAPFVALFGCQVFAIQLPQLLLNLVVCGLLLDLFVAEVRLSTKAALACLLPFLLPSVIASSRLVEHQGGIIEPFVWILLLWCLRRRPLALGLVAGMGFLNREFTIYGIVALLALELLNGHWRERAWWRARLASTLAFLSVLAAVHLLRPLSTNAFGGHPELRWRGLERAWVRLGAATGDYLPVLFGWADRPLRRFAIRSDLRCGHDALLIVGLVFGALLLARVVWLWARKRPCLAQAGLPLYLVLVSGLTIGVYVVFGRGGGQAMHIRYVMLVLLLPVGLVAAALMLETQRSWRRLIVAGLCLLAGANAWDHARLALDCLRHPPTSPYRALVNELESRGVRTGVAPYWVAYHVSYLSGETIRLAARDYPRISEYAGLAAREHARPVSITDAPCAAGQEPIVDWCLAAPPP